MKLHQPIYQQNLEAILPYGRFYLHFYIKLPYVFIYTAQGTLALV